MHCVVLDPTRDGVESALLVPRRTYEVIEKAKEDAAMARYCRECKRIYGDDLPRAKKPSEEPDSFSTCDDFGAPDWFCDSSIFGNATTEPQRAIPEADVNWKPAASRGRFAHKLLLGVVKGLLVLGATVAVTWSICAYVWPWLEENFVFLFLVTSVFVSCLYGPRR